MKTASKLGAGIGGLIALYLIVYNGTNSGRVITSAAGGSSSVIKTLQGR